MCRKIMVLLLLAGLVSCRNDTGVRLFDMNYFNNRLTIPGVLNVIESHFFTIGPLETNISTLLTSNALQPDEVSRIEPFFATLTALDGADLAFIEEISVRICPTDGQGNCQLEIFFLDDIPFNVRDQIELLPSLSNIKEFIIDQQSFTIQVVLLRLRDFSPANVELQFDFALEARQ